MGEKCMDDVETGGMKMMSRACYARQRQAHSLIVAGMSNDWSSAALAINVHVLPALQHSVQAQCTGTSLSFVPWQ